jgi:hypothetical protein
VYYARFHPGGSLGRHWGHQGPKWRVLFPPRAWTHRMVAIHKVVNNQLSGARDMQVDLINYLLRPRDCLHKFNPYYLRLVTHLEVSD